MRSKRESKERGIQFIGVAFMKCRELTNNLRSTTKLCVVNVNDVFYTLWVSSIELYFCRVLISRI